ncbi:MAG: FtsX-like permease family protein [Eubacteriaceae bacterium]
MLFKNSLKTFKKKVVQLLAIGIIIFLSSFIYTAMFYAISSLQEPAEEFFNKNNQEDFSVNIINSLTEDETNKYLSEYDLNQGLVSLINIKKVNIDIYYDVLNERKKIFEEKFKEYELELREYKDVSYELNENNHKIRIIKNSININKPMIEDGDFPSAKYEIAITKIYAKKNNIVIGDKISIDETPYKVVGFVLFPDYNLPLFNSELIIDNSKQTLGLVSDNAYENLGGEESFHFAGIDKVDFSEEVFQKEVIDKIEKEEQLDFIVNIVSTKNQMRSGAVYEEIRGGKAMSLGLSIMIAAIAIMVVAIIIYKILKSEKGQIGLLKALGYSNMEIASSYIGLISLISFPMLIFGYYVGKFTSVYLRDFYLEFYLLPSVSINSNLSVLLIAVFVPLIFFIGLSMFIVNKMLSRKTIDLLRVSEQDKVNKVTIIITQLLKNAKATTKFKLSFIFNNTGKFIVFFLGIVFASILIMYSLMTHGLFDRMLVDYYNNVEYNYKGYIDITKPLPIINNGQEKFFEYSDAKFNDDHITLMGISNNSELHKIYNNDESNITMKLQNGVIINESISIKYDKGIDDKIAIIINSKEYNYEIVGISKDYNDYKVYMNIETLSKILSDNKSTDLFNGLFSKTVLDKNEFLSVINKWDILNQSELMINFIKYAIYIMIFVSMLIAIIVLYILTMLTVEDKYYDISLLKVMGYNNKEVNSMILNSYFIYSIFSFIISVPLAVLLLNSTVKYLVEYFDMILPLKFEIWQVLVGLLIIVSIFFIGTTNAKRKIDNVPLQEILKQYRE